MKIKVTRTDTVTSLAQESILRMTVSQWSVMRRHGEAGGRAQLLEGLEVGMDLWECVAVLVEGLIKVLVGKVGDSGRKMMSERGTVMNFKGRAWL